jgi:hypothetical protein
MKIITHKYFPINNLFTSVGVFVLYCIIAIGAYIPSVSNGFMSDDFTWLELLSGGPGSDYNFNDRFFLPLAHYIQYALLFLTGENTLLVHAFQLLIHVINAYLLFLIINRFQKYQNEKISWIALASGLFFLLCPYNTEAVNWFAAISYTLSTYFLLMSVIEGLKAIDTGKNKYIFNYALLYLLSLLSKEISISAILIPIVVIAFGLISKSKQIYKLFIYGIGVLILYLVLRTIILGSVIGGYGTDIHTQFSPDF